MAGDVESIGVELASRLLEAVFDVRSVQDVGVNQPGWVIAEATTTVREEVQRSVGINIGILG